MSKYANYAVWIVILSWNRNNQIITSMVKCFKLWYIAGQTLWRMTRGRKLKLWNPQKTRWIQWICISCMKDVRAQKVDLMTITVQLLLHQEESKFILSLFNFYITPFIRGSEDTDPDFATLHPVLRHWYLMIKIHMWGSQIEVNAELWKVTRAYNWVSFGGTFSWEMVKEGYLWSDLISELFVIVKNGAELTDTFLNALFPCEGERVGRGQSLQEKDMSCHFKNCSVTMDRWTM